MSGSRSPEGPRERTEFEKARAAGRLRPVAFIRGDATDAELAAFADLLAGNETLPSRMDGAPVLLEHRHPDDL